MGKVTWQWHDDPEGVDFEFKVAACIFFVLVLDQRTGCGCRGERKALGGVPVAYQILSPVRGRSKWHRQAEAKKARV